MNTVDYMDEQEEEQSAFRPPAGMENEFPSSSQTGMPPNMQQTQNFTGGNPNGNNNNNGWFGGGGGGGFGGFGGTSCVCYIVLSSPTRKFVQIGSKFVKLSPVTTCFSK